MIVKNVATLKVATLQLYREDEKNAYNYKLSMFAGHTSNFKNTNKRSRI